MTSRGIRGLWRVAGQLVLAVLMGSGALASEDPLEPPALADYIRWGPVRARPTVNLSNLGVDDNVFFATGSEKPVSDYRMTLGGRLQGLMLFGDRAFLTFDERLNYTLYDKYGSATIDPDTGLKVPSQNYLNQYFTSKVTFPFSGWGVYGAIDLINTETRPTSEFNSRVKQKIEIGTMGFVVELGWRTYIEFERSRSSWNYDQQNSPSTAEKLDRTEQSNTLRVNYRLTGPTRLTLDTAVVDYSFDDDRARDSTELRVLPGFTFGENSRLGGTVQIGYSKFDVSDPNRPDFDSTIGLGSIRYRMGSGTTLVLDGGREVGFAVFGANTFYLNRFVGARVTHYFNPIIGGTIAGERGKLGYPQNLPYRLDDNREYELGVLFRALQTQAGKTVQYGLTWRRTRRDTTVEPPLVSSDFDQSRTVWGFTANAGF